MSLSAERLTCSSSIFSATFYEEIFYTGFIAVWRLKTGSFLQDSASVLLAGENERQRDEEKNDGLRVREEKQQRNRLC